MRHALRMPRAIGPLAVAALSLLLSGGGSPGPPRDPEPIPTPDLRPVHRHPPGVAPRGVLGPEPVERRLRSGRGHGWLVRLDAGDYAHVQIEQLGADVALALFDPAGSFLGEVDTITPMGHDGEEHLHIRASSRGLHRLELRAIAERGEDGAYRARLAARRPATPGDLRRVEAEAVFHRGVALRRAGRLAEALPLLVRSEALFGRLGDERRQAEARLGRCAVNYRLGSYRRATPACEFAAAFFRRHGDPLDLVIALNLLGKIHSNLDDPWSALRALEESRGLVEALGDPWLVAEVHTDLGLAHRQLSEFPPALAELDAALEIWERLGEAERAAFVLHERGLIYRKLGQLEKATDDFRSTLERRPPGSPRRPLSLIALAMALLEQGGGSAAVEPLEQALGPLEEALEIEERTGNRGGVATVLTAMGLVYQQTGRPEEAASRYREALPLARSAGDRELLGSLYFNLAGLARDPTDEAAILLQHALDQYRAAGNREAQLATLLALARAERARGRLHNGMQHLETARILFLELRQRLSRPDLRISFMAHRWDLFDSAIDLLMELHRQSPDHGSDVRAFEMSEQARARGLLDLVSGGAGFEPATPSGDVLSLGEVQRRLLDPETVLLDYKLGAARSYLWVVEHDRLTTFELPPRERLENLARAFHSQLARPPRPAATAELERTGTALSRALLCPARERLPRRRLLVVAQGELLYLPFAALRLSACDDPEAGPAVPLATEHPIVAGPSASALAALRHRPRPRPERTLTVIADPVFDRCDRRVAAAHRGRGCDARYPRLSHSETESAAILRLVPPGERAAALGFEARRDRLDGLLTGSRFLHFATHTDTTSEPPRLVLSQVDREGRPLDPSHLTADEIARLPLAADLVVLGGCDTGSGRRFRGEGLVGLAHAFLEAGAGGVLATLWPIDDRATAVFMGRFYRHLLHGRAAPATALARAQHEMQSDPRWRAPYYWAGFVLLGEGVASPPAESEPAESGLLAAGE